MIANINGRVNSVETDSIVVEVGGIGLRVNVPNLLAGSAKVGDVVSLQTHLIVRETELSLYGFETNEERQYFILMIGVSGIGPRIGLAILSSISPNAIQRAVIHEQFEVFSAVPGIGKKTAQKILLHLEGRLPSVDGLEPLSMHDDRDVEVLAALTALGYSVVEAQAAVQGIPKDAPADVEARLKLALGYFTSPN